MSAKYKEARSELLKDIVPEEDYNVKTSKFNFLLFYFYQLVYLELVVAFTIYSAAACAVKNQRPLPSKLLLRDLKSGLIQIKVKEPRKVMF